MPVWKAVALHAWQVLGSGAGDVVGTGVTQCLSATSRNYLNGLDQCQQIQTAVAVCLCFLLLIT